MLRWTSIGAMLVVCGGGVTATGCAVTPMCGGGSGGGGPRAGAAEGEGCDAAEPGEPAGSSTAANGGDVGGSPSTVPTTGTVVPTTTASGVVAPPGATSAPSDGNGDSSDVGHGADGPVPVATAPEPSSSDTPSDPSGDTPPSSGSAPEENTPSDDSTDETDEPGSGDDSTAAGGSAAVEQLIEYLELERGQRAPIEDQAFARVALSKEQAEHAAGLLWEDRAASIADTRRAEHEAQAITVDGKTLRYEFSTFGDAPPDGRSLYISLHGGGNAEPSVNDQQWENQKTLYQPDEGVYLAPRAPTDTWNLWHEAHIDPMFARLITNLVVLENVNPDRVYVMGYSAGGDGVYQLGPRMADYWAAAAAMAGHPNEAEPLSLRNIGFTVHVGALDTGYDRNLVAQEWSDKLQQLKASDPDGYSHVVEIHANKPHWMDLEDAVAVPWMAEFTRDTTPERIVWYQDDITHPTFYWLAVESAQAGTLITAEVDGQRVEVSSDDVSEVQIRLNDELLDLDQPVTVSFNGVESHSGPVTRTIAVLAQTLDEREDPRLMFSAQVQVN